MYTFALDGQGDAPVLATVHAPRAEGWNGLAVPVATAAEARAWVAAMVENDGEDSVYTGLVLEDETGIIVQRVEDDDDDRWPRGTDGLYALDGFVWEASV